MITCYINQDKAFFSRRLDSTGHYRAKCYYCSNEWAKREPIKLETHLGFKCAKYPENIREYWVAKAIDKQNNYQQTSATKKRKEFLLELKDYLQGSTTGDFLADQVSSIVEKTGVEKFAAFVTDSESNCHRAREIIERTYLHVIDMKCAAHAINLIAADFSKNLIVASFISELNKVIEFFNRSHAANKELEKGLRNMKISEGRLQTYVKIRWRFLFNSVDSILHTRPVFDWIIREKPEIITSIQVKNQLKNNEFFSMGQTVARIIESIKDCILKLKARTVTLADCYIQMLKLAAIINRLPSSNTLRSAIIGYGLNNKAFQIACHIVAKYEQALGYGENMSHHLLTQLRQFK
ncbi:ribonuclease H-like domain-containing protein [Rhizophagus clarus]|uniref:Ribonuclease H-like domain-containing protein n=1 Tax=Rhizophagus clarus TaxID=94130 RepID=A0A8H3M5H4_9GLOM|nr:ribonuclease H-like domain-containing protein [Rhizophagus clarus]